MLILPNIVISKELYQLEIFTGIMCDILSKASLKSKNKIYDLDVFI